MSAIPPSIAARPDRAVPRHGCIEQTLNPDPYKPKGPAPGKSNPKASLLSVISVGSVPSVLRHFRKNMKHRERGERTQRAQRRLHRDCSFLLMANRGGENLLH